MGAAWTIDGHSRHAAPVSLLLTCLEISVPLWLPHLTMAGPGILPQGGHARSPRGQAVPGSRHCVRGPRWTDGPIVWCVGSPARGGTRAELGATVARAGAESDPVTPSWRQRWTWLSGAASAQLSGSCSGRSWSGTRRRWHPSASALSAAATGRTTRRTGRGESGVGWGSCSPLPLPQGMVTLMPGSTVPCTEGGSSPTPSGLARGWGTLLECAVDHERTLVLSTHGSSRLATLTPTQVPASGGGAADSPGCLVPAARSHH